MRFRHARVRRQAASAVEFALVAPFLVTIMLGMFEVSRALLVKETLTNAAHRGARTASQPGKSNTNVKADVSEIMSSGKITGYTVTVKVNGKVADTQTAKKNDQVSVQVSVSVKDVYWISSLFVKAEQTLNETVVMMRQG